MPAATLKHIARETGLAVSSVSYALRGAPNIPPETARRVREVAERLGYRRNARIGELMAQVRRGRGPDVRDLLALVWLETGAGRSYTREVAEGAKSRAEQRGYALQEFTLAEAGGRPRRLADILAARGIPGVVFAPVFLRSRVELDWPWEQFAVAVIGTAEWPVALSRAAHHHYEAMRLALAGLARLGARRPAVWLHRAADERAHRGWQAAWLAYGPTSARSRLWLTEGDREIEDIAAWLARTRADGVIVSDSGYTPRLRATGWDGVVVTLNRRTPRDVPGIDQAYGVIAGHAVDLVVAQLQCNERDPPETPRALLFPGRWTEAAGRAHTVREKARSEAR